MAHHRPAQPVDHVGEGDVPGRLGEAVELEGERHAVERLSHGQQGGDADAPGQQHRAHRVAPEREIVAGLGDCQHVALAHRGVQADRPSGRVGLELDADAVARRLAGAVGDRVLAHQPVGQVDVDVGPRLEGGQHAGERRQFEGGHSGRGLPFAAHLHPQGRLAAAGRFRRVRQMQGHLLKDGHHRFGCRQPGGLGLDPGHQPVQFRGVVPQHGGLLAGRRRGGQHAPDHAASRVHRLHEEHRGGLRAAGPGGQRHRVVPRPLHRHLS